MTNHVSSIVFMLEIECFWCRIYAIPVFDIMETVLVKKLCFPPGLMLRLIAENLYVSNASFYQNFVGSYGSKPHDPLVQMPEHY
jgi:hypothetical protein